MSFNLSALAVRERAVTLFFILLLVAAGAYAFLMLGRAEDPNFTIKTMTVTIRLASQDHQPEVQVPLGAVLDDGRTTGVWVFDSATSTVRLQPVKLLRVTSETAVISGSKSGD